MTRAGRFLNELSVGYRSPVSAPAATIGTCPPILPVFEPTVHAKRRLGGAVRLGLPTPRSGSSIGIHREDVLFYEVSVVDYDNDCAKEFGRVRAEPQLPEFSRALAQHE